MTTHLNILLTGEKHLKQVSTAPRLEAELLLAHTLSITREKLLCTLEDKCSAEKEKKLYTLLTKRKKQIPFSYITGVKEFYTNEFIVTKDVLIPRPDSELLISKALQLLSYIKNQIILDVGTGSGCLAITLAKLLPKSKIIALDISEKALLIAKTNAQKHKVTKQITFIKSNLLCNVKKQKFDLIIANLPYLPHIPTVLKCEPIIALQGGGPFGLKIYEKFISELGIIQTKILLMEFDPRQTEKIINLLMNRFFDASITVYKDLAKHNRVIKCDFINSPDLHRQ